MGLMDIIFAVQILLCYVLLRLCRHARRWFLLSVHLGEDDPIKDTPSTHFFHLCLYQVLCCCSSISELRSFSSELVDSRISDPLECRLCFLDVGGFRDVDI